MYDSIIRKKEGKYNCHKGVSNNRREGGCLLYTSREKAEQATAAWENQIAEEAFGILLFDETEMTLEPLVCVKNASLVWERGCGSGTTALGAALATKKQDSLSLGLKQPGGVMYIEMCIRDRSDPAVVCGRRCQTETDYFDASGKKPASRGRNGCGADGKNRSAGTIRSRNRSFFGNIGKDESKSTGRYAYIPVSYTHLDVYKRQAFNIPHTDILS